MSFDPPNLLDPLILTKKIRALEIEMILFRGRVLPALALVPFLSLSGAASNADNKSATTTTSIPSASGITWETSLKSVIARATREHKPILHLQLFGKLNDALC